jgi:hypothetical protein
MSENIKKRLLNEYIPMTVWILFHLKAKLEMFFEDKMIRIFKYSCVQE